MQRDSLLTLGQGIVVMLVFVGFVPFRLSMALAQEGGPGLESPASKRSFGQVCNPGEPDTCSQADFLECSPQLGICVCQHYPDSFYDPTIKSCRLYESAECGSGTGHMPCTLHAVCPVGNKDTKCECTGYFTPYNRKCVLEHDKPCSVAEDYCNPDAHLNCTSTGRCGCDVGTSAFDAVINKCVLLEGQVCSVPGQDCHYGSHCLNGKCTCPDSSRPNQQGRCVIQHGNSCKRSTGRDICDINNFQECGVRNTCDCVESLDSVFDPSSTTCFLLWNASCQSEGMKCYRNSQCLEDKCACSSQNFKSNAERKCVVPFEGICDPSADIEQCDNLGFLTCVNGLCTCDDSTSLYSPEKNLCVLKADMECEKSEGSESESKGQPCVDHSICKDSPSGNPVCTCQGETLPNRNGKCVLAHNATCDTVHDLCDGDGLLACGDDNRCDCARPNEMTFLPTTGACAVLPGFGCEIGKNECITTADCNEDSLCQCKAGYEHWDDKCLVPYGNACSASTDDEECNVDHGVECRNGTCACGQKQLPEGQGPSVKCLGIKGGPCSESRPCYTEAFLMCRQGLCDCPSPGEQWYEEEEDRCISRASMRCTLLEEPGLVPMVCTGNATCLPGNDTVLPFGRCVCNDEFTKAGNGTCVHNNGALPFHQLHILVLLVPLFFLVSQ